MIEPLRFRFSTDDPEVMAENILPMSPGVTIGKCTTGRFSAHVDAVRLGGMALMCVNTRNIAVRSEPGGSYTSLTIPLREGFEIHRSRDGGDYGAECAYLHNMGQPLDLAAADASVLVVNVDDPFLTRTASKLCGGAPVPLPDMRSRISLSGPGGARLWRAASSLWLQVGKSTRPRSSDLSIAEREKDVAAAVLLAAGIDDGSPLSCIGQQRAIAGLKRVDDWILANLDKPISRAEMCEVSGLQVRALSRAFAKYHGEGPTQFVRNRRLDAVQRTLLGSEPGQTTVTRAAVDFGFYHLSRFAADYLAAFGEHPSDTLHK